MNYESETCEGCYRFDTDRIPDICSGCNPESAMRHFIPNLECRKVRALERIAGQLIAYTEGAAKAGGLQARFMSEALSLHRKIVEQGCGEQDKIEANET